jgi:phosphoglycolate phosphatase-like HAD superfamily hydrolase
MRDSRQLIGSLKDRGHTVVLASSAKQDEVDHYLDLLDARDPADAWTTSADVESTKPQPDLVESAITKIGGEGNGEQAVMVGDTPWDVKAAAGADVPTLAVLTGGFSEQQLSEAVAVAVFESVADLCAQLDDTPLA